jgi:hypothetical protein
MPYVMRGVQKVWKHEKDLTPEDILAPRSTAGDFKQGNPGRPKGEVNKRWKAKYTVNKETGCYVWKGKLKTRYGRGTFFDGEKTYDAQKYAWMREHGVLPKGKIYPACETPGCVNPRHLEEVPLKKTRPQSMFNVSQVLHIRRLYDRGESIVTIAKKYPASEKSVGMVARRKSYTWVPEEQ